MEIIRERRGAAARGLHDDARLMEINLGAWDGLTAAEARARDPALL
jgi:broad specificity phosphatase PhoE